MRQEVRTIPVTPLLSCSWMMSTQYVLLMQQLGLAFVLLQSMRGTLQGGSKANSCTEEAVPAGCADEVLRGAACASAVAAADEAAASAERAAWVPAWLKSCCSWGTDPIMPSKASIRGEMSMLADAEDPTWTFTVLPCIQQAAFKPCWTVLSGC